MKNEFKSGEFCRFPNEEIPHVLDILRANGHKVWDSYLVVDESDNIIICASDGDMMGHVLKCYESDEIKELSRHDFMCKALNFDLTSPLLDGEYPREQVNQITMEIRKLTGNYDDGLSIHLNDGFKHGLSYTDWCKRLCVEPIGQIDTLQDGDWFEGTFDQYAEAKRLSNLCGEGVYDPYEFAGHAVENDNHTLYDGEFICYNGKGCGATTNKLTAEEFLRRARNTFQEPTHTEPIGQSSQDVMNEVLPDSHPMKEVTPEMTGANIYPLTIVSDRYNGAYSGALFLAFNLDPCDIPDEIGAGDGDEMAFYEGDGHKKYKIGKGRTANDAAANLYCILNTPEFTASMLEVGEYMEITEIGPHENWVVQKMSNGYFYCNEYAEVISNDTLKGRRVDVEIKVKEL